MLHFIVECAHGKYGSEKKSKPEEELTVNATQLEELEKLACNKIEIWAKESRLSKHRYLVSILYDWKRWGRQEQVIEFVNHVIENDDGLIDFITSFLSKSKSHGMSDYVIKINWRIPLKSIEEFVSLKQIESRIRNMFASPNFELMDDKRKLAIKTFLDTIDGKIKSNF